MAKGTFDYNTYISTPPKKVKWLADDEFEIVVGTKRNYYKDIMDYAGQYIIKYIAFRLSKKDFSCKVTTLKVEEELYLTDEQKMKLSIVMNNIGEFFKRYEFSPESFCSFIRTLLRPMSLTDCVNSKSKKNN